MKTVLWKLMNFGKQKIRYWALSILNLLVPKNKNWIYIFDKRLRKDNAWAIAEYLAEGTFSEYSVYYYSRKEFNLQGNIVKVTHPLKALWYQLRSKYIFYSYRDFPHMKPCRKQIIVDTMHGSPLKNIGYLSGDSRFKRLWNFESTFTYILSLSPFFEDIIARAFGATTNQSLIVGYPRNDTIFNSEFSLRELGINEAEFKKIVLWMPTYRAHNAEGKNLDSSKAFPILSMENIDDLNRFLSENRLLLIIKPHPNQIELEVLQQNCSNIIVLRNEDLHKRDIQLYELFSQVDALVTDYSSVYFDFLLTLKPVAFAIDDLDQYGDKRGFTVEDPFTIMPGPKMYNVNDFKSFLGDLANGVDNYYDDRIRVNNLANKYQDGNSCARLMEVLGIKATE